MKNNPSYFREYRFCPESHAVVDGVEMCLDYPVESVTYVNLGKKSSVQEFLRELNRLFESEGKFYFRVESVEEFNWAVSFLPIEDNPDLGKYFSYREISDQDPIANERQLPSKMPQTHAVRGKLPINGFYRTNLWEWTVDQRGALSRLLIGGSWYDPKSSTLGGNPYEKFSTDTDSSIGFRLVKVPIFF